MFFNKRVRDPEMIRQAEEFEAELIRLEKRLEGLRERFEGITRDITMMDDLINRQETSL